MALASLADLSDVEDRLGRDLAAEESRKADALLRDASAVVRAYTRREFTLGTTVDRLRPRGYKIVLPQRPVVEVRSVSAVQSFGTMLTITPLAFWSWAGGHEVILGDPSLVINGPTIDYSDRNVWAEVDYSFGFAEIPDDVIAVTANIVVKALSMPQSGLVDMQTVGPYTVRYAGVNNGPLSLTEPDREVLNRYRSTVNSTMELRS